MNKETIEAQARQFAEEMIAGQEGKTPSTSPDMRDKAMSLMQSCFACGAATVLKTLAGMPLDEAFKELAEYVKESLEAGKEDAL